MKTDNPEPKLGAGHASAMFRQGLAELRAALYPESNVAQSAEYGLYVTKTPGEVWEARKMDAKDVGEEHKPALADAGRQSDARDVRGREDKQRDIERE